MLIAKIALAHASEILGCYKLLDGETLENYIVWPSPPLVLSVLLRSTFHSRFACPLTAFLGRLGSRSWRSLNKGENPKSETNKKWGKRVKSLETESEAKAAQKPLCSRELSFVSQSGTSCSLSLSLRPSDTAHLWTLFFWSSFHSHSLAEWIALAFFLILSFFSFLFFV